MIIASLSHMWNVTMILVGRTETNKGASFSWITCLSLCMCTVRPVWCGCGYHLNSDHWPIDGSLRLERRDLWCAVNHDEFSQRVPKAGEMKQNFMRRVAKDLCWMNEEARGKALVSVEQIIFSYAVWVRCRAQGHIRLRRDIRRELSAKLRMVKGEQ